MKQSQDGSFAPDPPPGWSPRSAYSVRLTVRQDSEGNRIFSYSEPLFDSDSPLDLRVGEDCIILLECDGAEGLSWSLATDAISVKEYDDERYYFALKYVDRGVAYARSDFPKGRKCTQICFGAQLNVDDPENDRHPYNLNVELERDGRTVPILIDPDIKNPSA
jgi:hypothetical protein